MWKLCAFYRIIFIDLQNQHACFLFFILLLSGGFSFTESYLYKINSIVIMLSSVSADNWLIKIELLLIYLDYNVFTVSVVRWCRLRGNLLFYFKSSDQFSEPQGVIVLEKCEPVIRNEKREHDGFVFFIGK